MELGYEPRQFNSRTCFLTYYLSLLSKYFLSAIMLEEDLILLGCRSQDLRTGSPLGHSTLEGQKWD